MPELPEAESILVGLRPTLLGARIDRIEVLRPDLLDEDPEAFASLLLDRIFRDASRRGKNLVLTLGSADPSPPPGGPTRPQAAEGGLDPRGTRAGAPPDPIRLVVNLGMSGRLLLLGGEARSEAPSHPGVRFRLSDSRTLVYDDVRRFGRLRILSPDAFRQWTRTLGPEPLSPGFTSRRLAEGLATSSTPIRSWLLDQRRIAGVGNIYANEALFRAHLDPRTPAHRISGQASGRLHRSLRSVLREAIRNRGTTLRDYRTADGSEGSHRAALRVYGREHHPCPECGTPIERIVFGGRSAFRCPTCQPWNGA